MMTWYAARDDKYNLPIVKGMKRDQRSLPEKSRTRILNDDEIRAVWSACSDIPIYGPLVKMLLLTAQRLRKVSEMKWSDLDDGVWTIATDAREKGNAGMLKLPDLALAAIKDLPGIKDNPHVFVAMVGNGSFNSFSQRKEELDEIAAEGHTQLAPPRSTPHRTLIDVPCRRASRYQRTRHGPCDRRRGRGL